MYLLRKRIFTVIFLLFLLGFSGWDAWKSRGALAAAVQGKTVQQAVTALENTVTSSLIGKMNFIEFFSWQQRLMDKREINNFAYIKDEDGFLHYSSFFREADPLLLDYALRVKRLQDYVQPRGTKVLFTVAPAKYIPGVTRLRPGLSANDPSDEVERMLIYLGRLGVQTLDLGEYLPGENLSYEQTFFRTDHHWTIPAAFEASRILVDTLNDRFGAGLEEGFLDPGQYQVKVYRKGMLGSMGRRTGVSFVGMEDFTALWPQFSNRYSRDCLEEDGTVTHREGQAEQTLMVPEVLEKEKKDIYRDSQYSLYLNGLRPYERIVNKSNPKGPKVFFIRDSYFSPVMTFLAPCFGEMEAVWSLENSDELDIEEHIRENRFDYIIVELYPYNIGDAAFNFFREG